MSLKTSLLSVFITLLISNIYASNLQYDPLLDPSVTIIQNTERNDKGEFLWYPGQLSAHLQRKRIEESAARSLNVGYPGNFYSPECKTFFRKEIILKKETAVEWISTGEVNLVLNGNIQNYTSNSITLPKGRTELLFEVTTEKNLPSIKVSIDGEISVKGWMASLNGSYWTFAESSPVFGTSGRAPLDDPEIDVVINPVSIIAVRNSNVEGNKAVIRKNGYILADFFHLEVGKVSFTAKGSGNLIAYVGESPEETLNENIAVFEQQPIEPYRLSQSGTEIVMPEMALRYLKLFSDGECEISDLKFTAKMWPVDFLMAFECDNNEINNLWKASVATLHTSTHGFYLDGIKRDYLPWSMDAVLSTFGGDYVFGDKQVSLNSLSVALLPYNPQKSDMGIPDYPLHALIGFNQFYKRYGDFNSILSYRDRMEQLLKFYETLQDERGFISANVGVSWGFVPGWATRQGPDRKGTPAYAQIMLYYNYKIGADFSEKWGDRSSASHYRKKAE